MITQVEPSAIDRNLQDEQSYLLALRRSTHTVLQTYDSWWPASYQTTSVQYAGVCELRGCDARGGRADLALGLRGLLLVNSLRFRPTSQAERI